jgi:Tfp pilus assembly protein PilE
VKRQGGFTLIQLAVVSLVSVVLAAFAAKALIEQFQEGVAEATGAYFFALKAGLEDYATHNVTAITNNTAVAGYANPLAPTLAELKAAGHVTDAFPTMTPFKQTLTFVVTRSAACPNAGCLISSYVYGNSPINVPGANNSYLATIVRTKSQGYGIASSDFNTSQLVGLLCQPIANPSGALPNMVGACTVLNAGFYAQFVRRGDDRETTLNNSLTVNGTTTVASLYSTGTVASLTGNVGAGTGTTGCRMAELLASGQIVSRTSDCITRVFVESTVADGGQVRLMNPSNQQTVRIRGTNGEILAGNGTSTTVTVDGSQGRITTNGLTPASLPTGWTGGVNTQDVAARGTVGAWDGTNLRATVGANGEIAARDGAGSTTALLDGLNGKASAQTLLATSSGTVGAACTTIGDQRQRTGAPGAYVTCQNSVWVPLGSRVVASDASCTIAGEYAMDSTGQAMVCKQVGGGPGGVFVPARYLMSDFVFIASSLVTDGSVVPKPVCATVGGTTGLSLIFVVPQTEGSADGAFNRYAVDNGTSWTVRLKRGDDSTALAGAAALAQQYCYYSS